MALERCLPWTCYCMLFAFPYLWSPGLYKEISMSMKSGHVRPMFFTNAWHAFNAQYNRLFINLISLSPEDVLFIWFSKPMTFLSGTTGCLELSL